jgi:hypothetical protein
VSEPEARKNATPERGGAERPRSAEPQASERKEMVSEPEARKNATPERGGAERPRSAEPQASERKEMVSEPEARMTGPGEPVTVRLNPTAARLLATLCVELGTDDPSGLVVRALGLLDLAQRTRRQGGRLVFVNPQGEAAEVAF